MQALLDLLDRRPRPTFAGYGEPPGPTATTRAAPHVRDGMSVTRAMNCVIVALIPCVLMALFNAGHQANLNMEQAAVVSAPGWRGAVLEALGIGYGPFDVWAAMWHGALYYVPVLAVALIVGELWERLFATLRKRERAQGLLVIAFLFSLSLPPTIPLWQVALGMSFGIVVAKEVFGGLGKNFLNPALTGLAFLYATYPEQIVGETAWTVVEGATGATTSWMQAFLGAVPGPFGVTSTLACLLGAAVLLATRVASLRVMAGALFGMIAAAFLFNQFVGDEIPFGDLSWHWHLVLGSFAFGVVFLATDPVTAAATDTGRWIYGILIGSLVVLIRVANVTHPDGVMYAILFGNIVAPLIDYLVGRANIRKRARRNA